MSYPLAGLVRVLTLATAPTTPTSTTMSESPAQFRPEHVAQTRQVTDEDKTQPVQDILNALRLLSNSRQSAPTAPTGVPSEWDRLRTLTREKPSDVDSWLKLVDVAEEGGNFEQINQTYEAVLEAYPNTVCNSPVAVLRA